MEIPEFTCLCPKTETKGTGVDCFFNHAIPLQKQFDSGIFGFAENPDYAPIVVNGSLAIEGLVVGLIRDGRTL